MPKEKPKVNIGQVIRSYRGQRGLSQGDIERRTGLLRCYLSRVENGHTVPSLETLDYAGNCEPAWTVGGDYYDFLDLGAGRLGVLLADDAHSFAESVWLLLTAPDLRRQLGQAGRRLFEAEFTWDRAWTKLDL